MSWTVEEGVAAHEHISPDLRPSCTRCGDLSTPGDKWCTTCGTWLLLSAPLSSDLAARRRALLLAGEAVQPKQEASVIVCYVEGCEGEVTERLRLHVGDNPTKEVLACAQHADFLRSLAF